MSVAGQRSMLLGQRVQPRGLRYARKLASRAPRRALPVAASADYETLKRYKVVKASTGETVEITSLWQASAGQRVVLPFLTHFGDLTSWEMAQNLVKALPTLESSGIQVIVIGLGTLENAVEFSRQLRFPLKLLHADPDGTVYQALGFASGFGPELDINPYLKMVPMFAGIGSPGTLQEMLRGCTGDRSSKQLFMSPSPFDFMGRDYQRPMELATQRLFNLMGIIPKWSDLTPPNAELLTQQGGMVAFEGEQLLFKHVDSGILKHADIDEVVAAALPAAEYAAIEA